MKYEHIITIEPGKRSGKPCIRGLRMTVGDVLSYLVAGMTEKEVLAEFPNLTHEDILACLSYAADRERFDPLTFRKIFVSRQEEFDEMNVTTDKLSDAI